MCMSNVYKHKILLEKVSFHLLLVIKKSVRKKLFEAQNFILCSFMCEIEFT